MSRCTNSLTTAGIIADLFYLLDAIVCRDISKKMYTMNDAFAKGLAAQMSIRVKLLF